MSEKLRVSESGWVRSAESVIGLTADRLPALFGAFLVAEFFFKFGSFTLECIAFLALWRVLDLGFRRVSRSPS